MTKGKGAVRVGVLMGGLSAEREVSLKTGAAVADALDRRGYRTARIDVGEEIARDLRRRRIDVAFLALHGRGGEDGTIQGLLESMGVAYTGSGVLASALAMDKVQAKRIFKALSIPTPPYETMNKGRRARGVWPLEFLEPPVVVKPASEGSTIGVSILFRRRGLESALQEAFRYDDHVLVEKYIPGRELTVGIMESEPLPVVEIVAPRGFYDYRAKYQGGGTKYLVPAPLHPARAKRLQRIALAAHEALGCRGVSRVDFRLDEGGKPFVLEVNTIPGMTATSLLPKSAAAEGVDFDELVERILQDALRRRRGAGGK